MKPSFQEMDSLLTFLTGTLTTDMLFKVLINQTKHKLYHKGQRIWPGSALFNKKTFFSNKYHN